MSGSILPVLDTCMLAAPFLIIFAMGMLGLDERFVHHGAPGPRRSFCQAEGDDRFLSDPDGKPWKMHPGRQIEARIIHSPASGVCESVLRDTGPAHRLI